MKQQILALTLVLVLLALPMASLAEDTDPASVLNAMVAAYMAGDIDAAMAYYADDAVMTVTNTGEVYDGAAPIRAFFEMMQGLNYVVRMEILSVDGNTLNVRGYHTSDNSRGMGLPDESIISEDIWVIENGKIQSELFTWTPETMAKMAAAKEAMAAKSLPETGVAPQPLAPVWVLTLGALALLLAAWVWKRASA